MRNAMRALVTAAIMFAVSISAGAQAGSPIFAPVESRVLSSNIVTLGIAGYGLPRSVSIVPSTLKAKAGLITTLPLRNARLGEGDVMLTASGRPVFVIRGETPNYENWSRL